MADSVLPANFTLPWTVCDHAANCGSINMNRIIFFMMVVLIPMEKSSRRTAMGNFFHQDWICYVNNDDSR